MRNQSLFSMRSFGAQKLISQNKIVAPEIKRAAHAALLRRFGRSALLIEIAFQALRARRVTQLPECLGFNLADALARHVELLAHLLQRA